ncbi:MAG: hypothetical protein WBA57_21185 [Elainellaceae cyanobacterium]
MFKLSQLGDFASNLLALSETSMRLTVIDAAKFKAIALPQAQ